MQSTPNPGTWTGFPCCFPSKWFTIPRGDEMPARKRTPTKPKKGAPQTPEKEDGFGTVRWAVAEAQGFLTSKIIRRLQDIETAARRDDADADSAVICAGVRLSEDLRIADPEEWQRTTGRELPRNVEELRALMADCGFSPDFIAAGDWTPCEVGPVLLKRLSAVAAKPPTARPEQVTTADDESHDPVEDALRGQSLTLYRVLRPRRNWVAYGTLEDEDCDWRNPPPDDATIRIALKKLQSALSIMGPHAPSLEIDHVHRRVKLIPPGT